jgi:succinate dehydrogenase/fumarate reductase flavoprotein subunit
LLLHREIVAAVEHTVNFFEGITMRKREMIKTDVLIVGGGIAGAFAAIRAAEFGGEVTLVDKAVLGRSGCSAVASGIYAAYMPGDDIDVWLKECVEDLTNPYMFDQIQSLKAIKKTHDLLELMDSWGVKFVKAYGEIMRLMSSGGALSRNVMLEESGSQMMKTLGAVAKDRGVKVISRVMVTDLLTSDGKSPTQGEVVGAIGFHTQKGEIFTFQARANVLCTGPFSLIENMPRNIFGDGIGAAHRAGADLCGLDKHGVMIVPQGLKSAPGIVMLLGMGARLYNGKGERFMERYDPQLLEKTTRNWLGLSAAKEVREGRGPIFMDMTHFTSEKFERVRAVIPIVMENFEAAGFDPARDHIPYTPELRITTVSGGGTCITAEGASSLKGLFAAGDSSDYARATTGSPLSSCAVTGYWAGEGAGQYATEDSGGTIDEKQVEQLAKEIASPLHRKQGIAFDSLYEEIMQVTEEQVGIFMHGDRLQEGIGKMEYINREKAQNLSARDPHQLAKVHGLKNMAEVLELMIRAHLYREESRGGFVREDYPELDNINWLKWIKMKRHGENVRITADPIPVDIYPLKPLREKSIHPIFKD